MRSTVVPSKWLREPGHRLSATPYHSAARAARQTLQALETQPLVALAKGGKSGIFNGPRFARQYVTSAEHGVALLSGTEIIAADISEAPLIAKKQATSMPYMLLERGTTLITSYGTVGRLGYARSDMVGKVGSDNVMKVVPDVSKIRPGYLFAFLSTRFGIAIATVGTTGGTVPFLPPERVFDLPVPRLADELEEKAHCLVEEAAELRVQSASERRAAISLVEKLLGWSPRPLRCLSTATSSSALQRRLDAFHHSTPVVDARASLAGHATSVRLGEIVEEVFEPGRGARIKVHDPKFGVPFLSSSSVFRLNPEAEYLVSRKRTPNIERLLIEANDLLIPRSGQLGGIVGRAVLPLTSYVGSAASEHLVRVRCRAEDDKFLLWAILAAQPGYYAAIGTAFGSSIPSLDCSLLAELLVPQFETDERQHLVGLAKSASAKLIRALSAEYEAVRLVSNAIEEAA